MSERVRLTGVKTLVKDNTFKIPEMGVGVVIGKRESLRNIGAISKFELLREAERCDKGVVELTTILATQFAIFRTDRGKANEITPSGLDYMRATRMLIGKGVETPYLPTMTTMAVMRWGVDKNSDSRVFLSTNTYVPEKELAFLQRRGVDVSDKYFRDIEKNYSRLAGSTLVVVGDDMGFQSVVMRRKEGDSFYSGMWTLPGGHADKPDEVIALEELREETNILTRDLIKAKPLGSVDHVILTGDATSLAGSNISPLEVSREMSLERYLNLVWRLDISESEYSDESFKYILKGRDGNGDWTLVPDYFIPELISRSQLTPIAQCALEMAGFI